MKVTGATFLVPRTVDEALDLLAESGTWPVLLAGGTHVMSRLQGGPQHGSWIDLSGINGFDGIRVSDSGTVLGPAVSYTTLLDPMQRRTPTLLRQIAAGITGGPQIRNQGTIGGSACYANPGSDVPTGLVALGARMHIASRARGPRSLPAAEFFTGPFLTTLSADELLTAVAIDRDAANDSWGYVKLKSAESSWPVAVAAARLQQRPDQSCELTVTIGAATTVPCSLPPMELCCADVLQPQEAALVRQSVEEAEVTWWSDELGDAAYRRRVAPAIAIRAIEAAIAQRRTNG
jgi:carbon-monoxide dehydrogenase medium subunit